MTLIISAIFITAFYALTYITAILAHEFGHAWAYKRITGKTASVKITKKGFHLEDGKAFSDLTEEQYRDVLLAGIGIGFLILSTWFFFVPEGYNLMFFPILALYLWGCRSDINQLLQIWRRK